MHGLALSTLLAIVLSSSVDASVSSESPVTPNASPHLLDQTELEQRVLHLMIEEQALRRRQEVLSKSIADEIDQTTHARFFGGDVIHSGAYVEQDNMRVTGVVPGSPAHAAGLQENDRLLEINDTVGGDTLDASARLFWAFRRLNPGDLASVTFMRGEDRYTVQVPVIGQKQMQQIYARTKSAAQSLSETELGNQHREYQISRGQRYGLRAAIGQHRLGVWDGLLLLSVADGLATRLVTQIGVLVLEPADPDHPLRAGDVLTRVGHNQPFDAQHAVRLLYDYEDQPLIPLSVERDGNWLELELPYPASERLR